MNQYLIEQTILFLQRNSHPRPAAADEADTRPRRGLHIHRLTTAGLRRFFAYALPKSSAGTALRYSGRHDGQEAYR
jgi:hypothetical protein